MASLVLHYLEDWGPTLAEIRRVLTPGGRLLVSVDHPPYELFPEEFRDLADTSFLSFLFFVLQAG